MKNLIPALICLFLVIPCQGGIIYVDNNAPNEPAETLADATPPTPDPMTWETEPYATGASSIKMKATTATDASGPVEYQFWYTVGALGEARGWGTDPNFEDTTCAENSIYGYKVRARDALHNMTGYSSAETAQTPKSIQTLIDEAIATRAGPPYYPITVTVPEGTYVEDPVIYEPNITLESASDVTIQLVGGVGIRITADGCTLGGSPGHGFTILPDFVNTGIVIMVTDMGGLDDVEISHNVIDSNGSAFEVIEVVSVGTNENLDISHNIITLNDDFDFAIWLAGPINDLIVNDNIITSLSTTADAFSVIFDEVPVEGATISNNTITGATSEIWLGANDMNDILYTYNDFIDTKGAILVDETTEDAGADRLTNLNVSNNTFGTGSPTTMDSFGFLIVPNCEDGDIDWNTVQLRNNTFQVCQRLGATHSFASCSNGVGGPGELDAEHNWWNAADGPGTNVPAETVIPSVGCGSGDGVSTAVDYEPFWTNAAMTTDANCLSLALIFEQELIKFTVVAGQMHQFAVDINNVDNVSHNLTGLSIVEQVEGLSVRFMEPGVTQPVDINAGETFSATLEVDANNATTGNTYSLWARCLTDGDLQRADHAEFRFVVVQDPNLPDLQVTSEDFNFAPLPGVPNEQATISVTVWNVGATPANDVMVVFKDFETPIGLPQIISTLMPGESNTVEFQHTWPDASFRLITATVDPNDEIRELDETNNSGSKVYQIGSVPEMEASIIIVCSTPAGFVEGSIATISGQALYEIRVAHEPDYVYVPVNSSSVSTQVIHSSGQEDLPGLYTDMEGYFSVSFPVPGQADDEFDVVITITDGFLESVWQKRFDVYEPNPYTDLWVHSEDIMFDDNNPSLGETVSIEAVIHASNYNTKKETNAPVTFYEHHPTLGTFTIGSTQYVEQMPPGTSESVFASWTNVAEGIYCIEAALEPGFSDDNNGNNRADCPIVVGPIPGDIDVVIEAPLDNADVNASDVTSVVVLVTDDYGNIVPPCALDSIDLQFSGVDGRKVSLKNRFNWSSLRYEYSWRPPSDANGQACIEVTSQTVELVGSVLNDSDSICVNVLDNAPPSLRVRCSPSSALISQVVQIRVDSSEPLLDDQLDTITVTDSNGQPIPLDPCGPEHPWSTRWVYHTEPLPASTAKGTATVAVTGRDVRSNEGSGGRSFKVVNGDLWVYSEDITFSDPNPDLGETITIGATVHSSPSNTETLGQVPMTFYANHTIGGEYKIGLTLYIEEIPPGSDYFVSTTWRNAAEGAYIMRATLGPGFSDDNSANNEATRALFVGTECDFTDDGEVDHEDLAVFASLWLWYGQIGSIPQDIVNDGTVNFADFAYFANNWLIGK